MSWSRISRFAGCATDAHLVPDQLFPLPNIMDSDEPESGTLAFKELRKFVLDDTGFIVIVIIVVLQFAMCLLIFKRHWKEVVGRLPPGDPEAPVPPPSPAVSVASNNSVMPGQMPLPAETSVSEAETQLSTDDDSEVKTKLMSSVDYKPERFLSILNKECCIFIETRDFRNELAKKKRRDLETGTHSKLSLSGLYTNAV